MKYLRIAGLALAMTWPAIPSLATEPLDLGYQFANFYQYQDYSLAADLLTQFFSEYPSVSEDYYWSSAFFFSRVFLGDDNYEKLSEIYKTSTKHHKSFILDIFYLKATQQSKPFLARIADAETDSELLSWAKKILDHEDFVYDPLLEEISHASQLDLLWTDFFTTGDLEPIGKIVEVLAWKDITRHKFTELFAQGSNFKEAIKLLKEFGVEFSEKGIKSIDDIDILLVNTLYQGKLSSEFRRLMTLLDLSDQEVYTMAIKGSAFWSLRSNAQQHERVLSECKRLVADPTIPAYIMLRILLASLNE